MGWREAGRAVLNRRVQLGMRSRGDFAKAAGLTIKTLGELERGARSNFDPTTLAIVEQVLQWPSGTIVQLAGDHTPPTTAPLSPIASFIERLTAPPTLDEQVDTLRHVYGGLPEEYQQQVRDHVQRVIEAALWAQQTAAAVQEVAEVAGWDAEPETARVTSDRVSGVASER